VPSVDAEAHLNKIIATLQARRKGRAPVQVMIGDKVSLRTLSRSGALMSLNKAMELVDARDLNAMEIAEPVKPGIRARTRRGAKATQDRHAYETILNDLLRDEPTLNGY